jgi:hypothetical protein
VEDEERLTKVKAQVDKLMGKVNEPPAKFMKSKEKLAKLYGIYSNLHSLTLAPKGSLQNFSHSANILEAEFISGVKELKADMPDELSEKLKIAQLRHKNESRL